MRGQCPVQLIQLRTAGGCDRDRDAQVITPLAGSGLHRRVIEVRIELPGHLHDRVDEPFGVRAHHLDGERAGVLDQRLFGRNLVHGGQYRSNGLRLNRTLVSLVKTGINRTRSTAQRAVTDLLAVDARDGDDFLGGGAEKHLVGRTHVGLAHRARPPPPPPPPTRPPTISRALPSPPPPPPPLAGPEGVFLWGFLFCRY